NGAPIIEDWKSDDEDESVPQPKIEKKIVKHSVAKVEFVKPKQQSQNVRKTVKNVEKSRKSTNSKRGNQRNWNYIMSQRLGKQVKSPRKTTVKQGNQNRHNTLKPRGNQRNWNNMMSQRLGRKFEMLNKACYVCGSFNHNDCNYHQRQNINQKVVKPIWNNSNRVNHKNFAKKTHLNIKKNMVPKVALMRSGLVSFTTAKPVNTTQPKPIVNSARPIINVFNKAHSTVRRPIHKKTTFKNSYVNQKVNTVRSKTVNTARPKAIVNVVQGNVVNVVKASACWVWKPKTKVIDHVSKHNNASIILKKFDYIYAQSKSKSVMSWVPKDADFLTTCAGCPVTILNSKDHLGKFDGKADEGFFVRYSINSKAFRIFKNKTRIVEENFHIRFSENTPYVARSGPNWLFDIDTLTKSMNYKLVVTGNQYNDNAGTKACDDAGKARMEIVPGKDYILLPLWIVDPHFYQSSKSSQDDECQRSSDHGKKVDEVPRQKSECKDQEKENNDNITNNVIVASTIGVSAIGANLNKELLIDPEMSALEDISTFNFSIDHEDDDEQADINNLGTTIQVSPVLTTRIHKDHLIDQMDVKSAFLYEKIEEEIYVYQLLGFEDLDFPDKVYKVKKALYELHQAPRAWYKTLSTYLLDNRFHKGKIDKTLFIRRCTDYILLVQVYVDDIIFGSTKKELCIEFENMMHEKFQMSFKGELTFFLGLQVKQKQDGIFISQDKYVAEILRKYVYACARYQVNLKVSHLHAMKRIFRNLKGQPKFGLWYPKYSPFDLVAYTDSDYAGASLDRKSITGVLDYCEGKNHQWGGIDKCQAQEEIGKGSANPIDPHHIPTIIPPSISQLQKPKQHRKPRRKVTEVPQPSDPTKNVGDEAVNEEMDDSLERAATTDTSLDA
nr:hypothetical protein [Tanacetum cinerariifolium]